MDRLKTEWDKGVSKMKTLGQERKEEEKPQAQSAADISREDLLQLTMKLGARLKAAEKAHREVAGRARDAERDRDVLKAFTANTVLGTPGALDGIELDENALTQLYGGRDSDGSDAQSSALKEALARALAARDSETARADSEAAKRENASSKAEERIVSLELKLRDARRDADGAPEALAGLEAARRENAELREAHVVLRRAAEDARSRLADAESRLRRSENTSVEDKNAHASRARQLQTLEREKEALTKERDALRETNDVQNGQIVGERQRHDDREATHQRELAASRALGLAHAASLSARIAHLEAANAISKAAITAAAPARERAVAEALARAEADHTKRSSLARTILAEKDSKVEILRRRVAELESELASGGHEHRKFVEIAERQARREGALASEAAQSKLATSRLKRAIRDRDSEVADLASQLLACQKKLEDARRGLGRDATNLEYVKNLLVQYFSLRQNSSEQASLVPVLATVLAFTDDDLTLLRAQAQKWEASQSYWGGSSEPDAPNPLLKLTTLAPAPRHRKASPTNTS